MAPLAFGRYKVGFLGTGNMAHAFIKGLIESETVLPKSIFATNRSSRKLDRMVEHYGIHGLSSNEELFEHADVIVIAVKPQDLRLALEPLASVITDQHLIVSLAAGVTLREIRKILPSGDLARVMPNTALGVRASVIGLEFEKTTSPFSLYLKAFLSPLGTIVEVNEDEEMSALTVGCASGVGFVLELMVYWQDWLEEYGFTAGEARNMTVQTFYGASLMARSDDKRRLEDLQSHVTSKKGVTYSGLLSMRENEIERGLRIAFEKAVMRDRQLAKALENSSST